ncbi:hypothetical protein GQ457_12G022500 [Hibiscus cannabinus]
MGLTSNITAILNFIAILCSIPILASGIWLAQQPDNGCIHLFRWPVLVLGLLILLVSLAGFVGAYRHKETLLALYLCCMAILIALLLVLLVFAFIVTRSDGSYAVPGSGFKEYRLNGYSGWLRSQQLRGCFMISLSFLFVLMFDSQGVVNLQQSVATHL